MELLLILLNNSSFWNISGLFFFTYASQVIDLLYQIRSYTLAATTIYLINVKFGDVQGFYFIFYCRLLPHLQTGSDSYILIQVHIWVIQQIGFD